MSRVRENRMHGSRWRREETGNQSAQPRGTGRLPPTLHAPSMALAPLSYGFVDQDDRADDPQVRAARIRAGVAAEENRDADEPVG